MAQILPNVRIADARIRDGNPFERQDTGKLAARSEGSSTVIGKRERLLLSKPPTPVKLRTTSSTSANANANVNANTETAVAAPQNGSGNGGYADERGESNPAIDPLSQHILNRTNTAAISVHKLRTQVDSTALQSPTTPGSDALDGKGAVDTAKEVGGGGTGNAAGNVNAKDKRKGVSFFGRLIGGNKKKGAAALDGTTLDDGSEAGDSRSGVRTEGMEKVDNIGFNPRYPQPPPYVKTRTKFKKEKEFDRLFLAQELRCAADRNAPPVAGANPAPQSGSAATQNPVWAIEFSKDGKYLAAGGQDRVVRVWAVISTPEERSAVGNGESEGSIGEEKEGMRLSAPVFRQEPVREYHGHTRFHPRDDRFFLAGSLDTKLRLWSIPDKSVAFWKQTSDMVTAVSFTPDGKTCIAGTLSGLCLFYDTEGLKYQTQMHVKSTRGQNAKGSKITGIQAFHWPRGSGSEPGDVKLLITSNDSRIRLYNLRDKNLEMKFRGHENNCSQIRASFAADTGHIICGSEDRRAYIWSPTTGMEGGAEKRHERPVEMFEPHGSITTCAVIAPLKTRQVLGGSEDPIYDLCNPPPVTLVSRAESLAGSSRAPTEAGSALPTPTVDSTFINRKTAETTPAYQARSVHKDGHILVTADFTGAIKVFRQDCAYAKRTRLIVHSRDENWDAGSAFSKRTGSRFGGGGGVGRPSSILSGRRMGTGAAPSVKSGIVGRPRRDSTSTQPAEDRIRSWRQDIVAPSSASASMSNLSVVQQQQHGLGGGLESGIASPRRSMARSKSPRKSRLSVSSLGAGNGVGNSFSEATSAGPVRAATMGPIGMGMRMGEGSPETRFSAERTLVQMEDDGGGGVGEGGSVKESEDWGPGLSARSGEGDRAGDGVRWRRDSVSSDESDMSFRSARDGPAGEEEDEDGDEEDVEVREGDGEIRCQHCGGEEFMVRMVDREREVRMLVCGRCGRGVD
ncbi:WD40 repeat-like protein [Westerdykella ornata]|uniref:WD40 repeat-like protein n=1 Tax=Westerdykella ornata TaxID=318751 RepID=A0A6A6JYC4_WESOR|nr:WD40 repeat-like protein [Westerdykella ornata]KAF2281093.1 WD40 repeat-like protein [Westerdykella ornata]